MRIRSSSTSSSSAISMGRVVQMLWPISLCASSTVIVSSSPICRKAFGVKFCASLPAGDLLMKRLACGMEKAITNPPAMNAEALRKVRLEMFLISMEYSSGQFFSRVMDGGADTWVGAATADVAVHGGIDVSIGRRLV